MGSPSVNITSIGAIDTHPAFHSAKHIWPVGYTCHSQAPSTLDSSKLVWYTTKIYKVNAAVPIRFVITAADRDEWMLSAPTVEQVWQKVLREMKTPDVSINALE